ncbi:hypothetical protein ACQEVF_25485 [Nonomuraea polychroma]|uniref:hypothetical protein n=1 Tax=Nonomuraea polychroma TaxID=46176 RepID=UPI003D8BE079
MESARVILEVVAGLVPGKPQPEMTRRWVLTTKDWEGLSDEARGIALAELNGKAQGYAGWLMLQPDRLNWVRLDWLWP